ncbi:GNAT family acetyltransferase [Maridesulfovibrio ferrireducens]|uniref:GNAT family acetyltransferase n=1 Tax=Maridesulfovibrio ferrireducens TaxID=246191 RepID=UPI001A1889E7|nr:GNAT family acetyltransferase [Maridesulfovibrio ferrireducens]MBI9111142.1 GNAT family acetyltransferase [Maridesulfovibrio ferrireducens]
MQVREFKQEDEEKVIELWKECNLVAPWNDPKNDIRRKMIIDPDLFLVGIYKNEIVATVMGGYEGHRGWINYLAVSPEVQKKGFAKKIMNCVEDRIKAKGCPKINLQVRKTNTEVLAFYQGLGYEIDNVIGLGKRLISNDE